MNEKVTLLIPTRFDNRYVIQLCLETIRKYTTIPYRIIVGDAGVDEEAKKYLDAQPDIVVVKCPDPLRPKDYLARKVQTQYFLILHDDIQVLRDGWLSRRLEIMENNPDIGVLGILSHNYVYVPRWKRLFAKNSCLHNRFFPVVLTVRKEVQDELDLTWGKVGDRAGAFDTGAIAYLQFLRQKKWKFQHFDLWPDVRHWYCKTWAVGKKLLRHKCEFDIDKVISDRDRNIAAIRKILENKNF